MANTQQDRFDATVVGSGPNGLCAAIRLAQAGLSVALLEANSTIGGGCRSAELTLPGFVHDICSAVHPFGAGSPFLRSLPLESAGVSWVQPDFPLAHPLDSGQAAILHQSLAHTVRGLGRDGPAYQSLMAPLLKDWPELTAEFLQPLLHIPSRPVQMARFGWRCLSSCSGLAKTFFQEESTRALWAGLSAHSFLPLEQIPSSAFAVILAMLGHAVGWPFPRGGAQKLADGLAFIFRSLGGVIVTDCKVEDAHQLSATRVALFDLTPKQLLTLRNVQWPPSYRRRLEQFAYGPGVFKTDYALAGPIPWQAQACRCAGTVHVGGTLSEIALAERAATQGKHPERPFVLVAQPTFFDPTRAPDGKHTAWAYCHVPNGSTRDMTQAIEEQIERYAPGFRQLILARHVRTCADLEAHNANLVGGSIDGGAANLRQLMIRPILSSAPYRMPIKGWYLCSASTPPGGGVHGMCGFHAAETALRDWFS